MCSNGNGGSIIPHCLWHHIPGDVCGWYNAGGILGIHDRGQGMATSCIRST